MFEHFLNQKLDEWTARGRVRDATQIDDGSGWIMRFGARYRTKWLVFFGFFLTILVSTIVLDGLPALNPKVAAGAIAICSFVLGLGWASLWACATTIRLSDDAIETRFLWLSRQTLRWSDVTAVRYGSFWCPAIVIHDSDTGRKIMVPTDMDGYGTLYEYLERLRPEVVDSSVVNRNIDRFFD